MQNGAKKTPSVKDVPTEDPSEPIRSGVRFPLRLPLSLQTSQGEVQATTENVSAGGVLFMTDYPLEINSQVEFKLAIPASVLGTDSDVTVQCSGHVVRKEQADGDQKAAAIVIDKYTFEGATHS